ncbi:hypothetical protein [Absidia glauca]|uniref:SEC7 domain-containing protein n=1 Tax=Absidia glauca TaxID=4829 RepID=A0A163MK66_ABSGL|nr:hypothetical protein [Absidia glauca]
MNDDTSCSLPLTPSQPTGDNMDAQQVSSNKDVQAAFDQLTRRDSTSKVSSSPPSSFTQRLIDRGVPVPSFPNWERSSSPSTKSHHSSGVDQHDLSSSSGSLVNEFDSSAYYGLSPFVTSSFSTTTTPQLCLGNSNHHHNNNHNTSGNPQISDPTHTSASARIHHSDSRYFSLRHRYERENGPPYQQHHRFARQLHHSDHDEEDNDDDVDDHPSGSPDITKQLLNSRFLHLQHEDSDIELSDDDLEKHSPGLAPPASHHHTTITTPSPLLWRTATSGNKRKTDTGKLRSPSPLAPLPASFDGVEDEADDSSMVPPPSSMDRFNQMLAMKGYKGNSTESTPSATDHHNQHQQQQQRITASPFPLKQAPSPVKNIARSSPRTHLLQTPVFEVVNANTIKDRYLFLFNDLLLICKPIMDENIIVGGATVNSSINGNTQGDSRFRFRPNESSLFQVKNIVELSKLTLYLSQEDQQRQQNQHQQEQHQPPHLPALPRKMHPILASALRKFKSSAESGIAYLLDKQVLTLDPLSIANFLFKTPDLNRQKLGQYLGDRKHGDVYDAFLDCFRLVGLRLDEALRILLTTFRLPAHWESLEYVVEHFAKKWHDANQNVVKFHEDMVVKVVVAMLFLNAEIWYDADSDKDVFWYARKQKEKSDRQRLARRATTVDQYRDLAAKASAAAAAAATTAGSSPPSMATRSSTIVDHRHQHHRYLQHRGSVAIEPLHYITALRESSEQPYKPTLNDFLDRWTHYDQYALVPREFMEEMYRSILAERLETGLESKASSSSSSSSCDGVDNSEDNSQVINVIPYRLPTRLIKGVASTPITLSIPHADPGLQIKLRGQDLLIQPNILDFSTSSTQSFTITGNTLGRTSLMFIKSGINAGNYVSPTLPRTKTMVVERHFMRYTFQLAFSHTDMRAVKAAAIKAAREKAASVSTPLSNDAHMNSLGITASNGDPHLIGAHDPTTDTLPKSPMESATAATGRDESDGTLSSSAVEQEGSGITTSSKSTMVKRRYMFSVETAQEKMDWMAHLTRLCGCVVVLGGESSPTRTIKNIHTKKGSSTASILSAEERVALQVLKELLLADEVKKGTASVAMRTTETTTAASTTTPGATKNDTVNSPDLLTPTSAKTVEGEPLATDDKDGSADSKSVKQQKKPEDGDDNRNSLISLPGGATNVVTKRGYEIIKLVVQNSMVPFMLGFLRSQIE